MGDNYSSRYHWGEGVCLVCFFNIFMLQLEKPRLTEFTKQSMSHSHEEDSLVFVYLFHYLVW